MKKLPALSTTPRPAKRRAEIRGEEIKTTILIPAELWTRAKHLATNQRTSLRDVLITALAEHLAKTERRSR
jgi:hypothetical protein